jgi:3-dehydroquinate dehydratase-2
MQRFLVIHGPNLNLLGKRKPEIYGRSTLPQVNSRIMEYARRKKRKVDIFQSNIEGEIVNMIQGAKSYAGIVINPGAYTHTSIAIRDCIEAMRIPVIEVHLSNIRAREEFRQKSMIAPVCAGQITGLGWHGYVLALEYLISAGEKQ